MAIFPPALSEQIARRHGIVTTDDLTRHGFSAHAIRYQRTQGALVVVHRGTFRVATSPATFEALCAAACAAHPTAIITGVAAARLWGFRHVWQPDLPHVLVGHASTPLVRGVVLRRSRSIQADDAITRPDGINVASPPRAWFDCARDVDDDRFERLTEWVLDHHTTVPTLWRTAHRLCASGRNGAARVRRVMERRVDWQKPADSGLELRVLDRLAARGIPLIRQYPLRLDGGLVIHLDGADPDFRWGVEIDHVTWHGGRLDAQRDKQRDRRARLAGWQIDRITDQDVTDDFAGAIDELARLYAARRSGAA